MTAVLTDFLDFWDVALFFGVPLGLLIYTFVQRYRPRWSNDRIRRNPRP
jgi:cytosine/uracil/thiamine/allantoin permease